MKIQIQRNSLPVSTSDWSRCWRIYHGYGAERGSDISGRRGVDEKLPSFPKSEWEKVAHLFGLNPTIDKYQLKPFSTPHAYLPPSFHKRVIKDAIQWLDVYQERGSPKRETARIRLMDAVCITNGSFFTGLTFHSVARPRMCHFQGPRSGYARKSRARDVRNLCQ